VKPNSSAMHINHEKSFNPMTDKRTIGKGKRRSIHNNTNMPPNEIIQTPSISEFDAPEGYRAVSMTQAMMEYAKPVMEILKPDAMPEMNEAFQIAMALWNHALDVERNTESHNRDMLIALVSKELNMNRRKSDEFITRMADRKRTLLPSDIQPKNPRIMFIKKEGHVLIPEFDYDSLTLSGEAFIPDNEDKELLAMLHRMDKHIRYGNDYGEWEKFYNKCMDACKSRFKNWMICKGMDRYQEDFPFNIQVYLDFVYTYRHRDKITLKSITSDYFQEFLCDFVLRKVLLEPHDYIQFPPTLKTFYLFLPEIGYMEDAETIIESIDETEPRFINVLRKMYS